MKFEILLLLLMCSFSKAEAGGYNGNEDEYDDNGECGLVQRLGYKESYEIYSFPPPDSARASGCAWTFVATDDRCTLQFRTQDFERGVNDCEEQTLTLGDEYKKRRICEFGEPPRRFTSSGRMLFLNSSRRYENRYEQKRGVPARPSRLSGVVICAPVTPYRPPYMPTTAAPTTAAPTTAAPTTTKPPNCLQSELFDAPGNNSVSFSGDYVLTGAGLRVESLMIELALACPDQVRGCAARVTACYGQVAATRATLLAAAVASASESIEPVHSSLNNVAGIRCVTKSGLCKGTGPCSGPAEFGADHGGAARIQIFPDCDATDDQVCKFTVTLCVEPIK